MVRNVHAQTLGVVVKNYTAVTLPANCKPVNRCASCFMPRRSESSSGKRQGASAGAARRSRDAPRWPSLSKYKQLQREEKEEACEPELSAHRKAAYALKLNVLWLIERHGLERVGFLTLTFARHVVNYKEAQKLCTA